jgi:hypothetical protein
MGTREIKVTLMPGHEITLQSDAPDIEGLVSSIVSIMDKFSPDDIKVECGYDGFDIKSFREILIEASKDFIDAIALDKSKYQSVLASLEAVEHEAN